jgi:hypothetical protein
LGRKTVKSVKRKKGKYEGTGEKTKDKGKLKLK